MGESRVRFERDGALVTITLDRPESGNALDHLAILEIRKAAARCALEDGIRAVLLLAEGENFCVGGDMRIADGHNDSGISAREITIDFNAAMLQFAQMDAPLVTAVQGAAAGAGFALAAISDYVVADPSATFKYAYTGVGLSGDGGLTWTLPRLVGVRNFQSLYLTNRRVGAGEALDLGIVSELAEYGKHVERARAFACELAEGPTRAFGAVKRLVADSLNQGFATQLEAESQCITILAQSQDTKGAIDALFAKRKPVFQGK